MKRKYQVGGIIYEILQSKPLVKEKIDIRPIRSMVHTPISVDTEMTLEGYEPRYNFNQELKTNTEPTEFVTQDNRPDVVQLKIDTTPVKDNVESHISNTSVSNNESIWNKMLQQYGSNLGLKDEKAYLYLLGQIKHESDDFKYMEEIADGSAYEGRKDLGNTNKGDGKRYKGRGPIQVTGRSNYEKIYKDFFVPNGLGNYDIVNNPELANNPEIGSLLSIGWLAVTDNGRKAIAESNNYNIENLTKAINGGYNGLSDRIRRTNELLKQYS